MRPSPNRPIFSVFSLAVLIFMLRAAPVRAEVEMVVGIERTSLFVGESVGYQVALTDSRPIDDSLVPDISPLLNDFDVKTLQKQVRAPSGQSVRIVIQGRTIQDESVQTFGVVFTYILTPKKTGSLVVPVPVVRVGGKRLTPQSIQVGRQTSTREIGDGSIPITVRIPEPQDVVFMEIKPSRTRLYPFQPLTVDLIVQVKELPDVLGRRDASPLSILSEPPHLTIPWAESDAMLPKGLVPRQNAVDWLNGLVVQGRRRGVRGFAINNHTSRGIDFGIDDDWFSTGFSLGNMLRETPFQFTPSPVRIRRPDSDGRETGYWEYRFSRAFLPERIGAYAFGPVILKGSFAVADVRAREGAVFRQIDVVAPVVTVEIVDVPEENRPDGYIGAFGTFDWAVDIQPRKARVGEPMTLTLRLTGTGSTANVTPPDLTDHPDIAANFKTYPPTEDINERSCTFTYTVRPTRAGTIEFPSISTAFFDVEKERFMTLRSEPIPLEITETATLHGSPLFEGLPRRPPFAGDLQRSEQGLFANMTDPRDAGDQSVDFRRWIEILLTLGIVYAALVVGAAVRRRRNADPKRRRRQGALSRAQSRLADVKRESRGSPVSPERTTALCNALQGVLFGYVADWTDGAEQGMTTKDACWKLLEFGATERTVAGVRGILETLDGARYGGFDLRSLDELAEGTEVVLQRLRAELGKKRPSASTPR